MRDRKLEARVTQRRFLARWAGRAEGTEPLRPAGVLRLEGFSVHRRRAADSATACRKIKREDTTQEAIGRQPSGDSKVRHPREARGLQPQLQFALKRPPIRSLGEQLRRLHREQGGLQLPM